MIQELMVSWYLRDLDLLSKGCQCDSESRQVSTELLLGCRGQNRAAHRARHVYLQAAPPAPSVCVCVSLHGVC